MIWETDHMVRRIYMADHHSKNVKPSWFGESIGHYEGGDTLVIDNDRLAGPGTAFSIGFARPIARSCMSSSGSSSRPTASRWMRSSRSKILTPSTSRSRWGDAGTRCPNRLLEMVCAENNGDHFGGNLFPVPHGRHSGLLTSRSRRASGRCATPWPKRARACRGPRAHAGATSGTPPVTTACFSRMRIASGNAW